MNKYNLLQKVDFLGLASKLSAVSIIVTVLMPGRESTAQAATFTEIGDAGELISDAQGPVIIPTFDTFDTIEGTFLDTGDIDLYQLQLGFDADVTITSFGEDLFLFDQIGRGLGTASNELSFSGVAGEIFYLGVNGTVALNEIGGTILDPSTPSFIGLGTLTSWEDPGIVLPVVLPYQVSLAATPPPPIPEPRTTLSLLALGTLGAGSTLKHKLKLSKSTERT